MGQFFALLPLPPLPPPPPKNQTNPNFEKLKNTAGDIIVLHVYQKPQLYEVQLLRHGMRLT